MQYGYCVNMLDQRGGTGAEWIPTLKAAGYDYVELPLAQIMSLDQQAFQAQVVLPLRQSGLPCLCCNNFFPASHCLTGPDADHPAAIAYAEQAMERVAALGVQKIVLGSSGARNMPMGFSRDIATQQMAELLTWLHPLAQSFGITIVLEPLNRLESNLLNSVDEALALAQRVNLSTVRVLADTFHMSVSNESRNRLTQAGGWLQHFHLAQALGRRVPCEGDDENWLDFFQCLHAIHYQGTLSVEAYIPAGAYDSQLAETLAFLKRCEKQRET